MEKSNDTYYYNHKTKVIILENERHMRCSFWHTRFQGLLFILALSTAGLGDAITSSWMIQQHGLMREGNIIIRQIISSYGISGFIEFKLWITFLILLAPFLILIKQREPVYWMINGYLVSFIVGGTLAMILNIQAATNSTLLMLPQHVILIFISLVLILTNIGDVIDRMTRPLAGSYLDCALNDIMIVLVFINQFTVKERQDTLG